MCLVDVEKAPKPMPACATPVTQGMIVRTKSDKAIQAQKSVMEFLLINHPWIAPFATRAANASSRIWLWVMAHHRRATKKKSAWCTRRMWVPSFPCRK